ncbi:hypothetical protein CLV98_101343 [Dyadobacter jejuensis]|uniref:Uncharacterized protein n=1 Tax=Dyadobacter jejuensis TaxID=1082580 RepID=A0A316AS45_9BACT|nr:hypothetical protein [Dyadobacter jejuensis]PWJ60166.1 hypothetical protein CLV98_101343 [Dyadobacter jejuensis]
MKKLLIVSTVFVLFFLIGNEAIAQCAMCRGTVESSIGNGRNNVGFGLNTGIMFLFVMPYLLVGVISYLWYKKSKKFQAERKIAMS